MKLDELKSAWQANAFPLPQTEEKNMSQITQMIEGNVSTMMAQQSQRFLRLMIWMGAVPLLVILLFYSMSDGFTNEDDSIGALFVIILPFVPLFLFFWSRYQSTKSFPVVPDADVRTQLPHTIHLLRRNQRAEVGLTLIVALLAIGGVVAASVGGTVVWVVLMLTSLLAIVIAAITWRAYQIKLGELEEDLRQLSELSF